jgi:FkbM family methyltransferase
VVLGKLAMSDAFLFYDFRLLTMFMRYYQALLRLPHFKGKSRLQHLAQIAFFVPQKSKILHGLIMELDPLEWAQMDILRTGCIEPLTSELYGQLLRSGDVYIDIGAHVGFHTLVARYFVGDKGKVIAIDPQPYNCQKILSNWRANNFENLLVYVAAAGNRNEAIILCDQSVTDKTRLSLCLEPVNNQAQRFRVPVIRLDEIVKEQSLEYVRLLKIDVEGYETEVLDGLGNHVNVVENIVIEVLGTQTGLSVKSLDLVKRIQTLGYNLRTVQGETWTPGSELPENNLWASRNESISFS